VGDNGANLKRIPAGLFCVFRLKTTPLFPVPPLLPARVSILIKGPHIFMLDQPPI